MYIGSATQTSLTDYVRSSVSDRSTEAQATQAASSASGQSAQQASSDMVRPANGDAQRVPPSEMVRPAKSANTDGTGRIVDVMA